MHSLQQGLGTAIEERGSENYWLLWSMLQPLWGCGLGASSAGRPEGLVAYLDFFPKNGGATPACQ